MDADRPYSYGNHDASVQQEKKMFKIMLLLMGLTSFAYGAYLPVKAELSQLLIRHAWQKSVDTKATIKPWGWADMHPVMRLQSEKHQQDLIVLAGDTGNVLAFAPGLSSITSQNNPSSTWLVSGHRDTHFTFLKDIAIGDLITTTQLDQNRRSFKVSAIDVIDISKQKISISDHKSELKLVTCFPFDAIVSGGSLRYVVTASFVSLLT